MDVVLSSVTKTHSDKTSLIVLGVLIKKKKKKKYSRESDVCHVYIVSRLIT